LDLKNQVEPALLSEIADLPEDEVILKAGEGDTDAFSLPMNATSPGFITTFITALATLMKPRI